MGFPTNFEQSIFLWVRFGRNSSRFLSHLRLLISHLFAPGSVSFGIFWEGGSGPSCINNDFHNQGGPGIGGVGGAPTHPSGAAGDTDDINIISTKCLDVDI